MKRLVSFFTNLIFAYETIVDYANSRNLEMNTDHMFQAVICLFGALFLMGTSTLLATIGYFFMPGLFVTFSVIFGIFMLLLLIFMIVKMVEAFDWN